MEEIKEIDNDNEDQDEIINDLDKLSFSGLNKKTEEMFV